MSHPSQADLAEVNRWQGEELGRLRAELAATKAQLDTLRREVAAGQPDLRREFRQLAASWRERLNVSWHMGCGHAVIPAGYEDVMRELWSWIHG